MAYIKLPLNTSKILHGEKNPTIFRMAIRFQKLQVQTNFINGTVNNCEFGLVSEEERSCSLSNYISAQEFVTSNERLIADFGKY